MTPSTVLTTETITAKVIPKRPITGMSAVFLPYLEPGIIDWESFEAHVARTFDAGLCPAVNMDTGFVHLLGHADKQRIVDIAAGVTGGNFVASAFVADQRGAAFAFDTYAAECDQIRSKGGTPIIFPSHGLNELPESQLIEALASIGDAIDRFIAFELGQMFVPHGRVLSLDGYRSLLDISSCIGAKHSSLDRVQEFSRLAIRDAVRPDFRVFTGNDLAIDMVMYGSDYLLGISTFAPDLFALRDAYWRDGDVRFHKLNDQLQFLGHFTFRMPVPAYRHSAAMFLQLRGWTKSDTIPAGEARRPDSDRKVLEVIGQDLGVL